MWLRGVQCRAACSIGRHPFELVESFLRRARERLHFCGVDPSLECTDLDLITIMHVGGLQSKWRRGSKGDLDDGIVVDKD